ncbi:MAG TPA: DoxX family protein [Patescibacteria group bacterium]|nr:DoxX family protein [Patescibacteria group bacterium]
MNTTAQTAQPSKALNITLWIAQVLLGGMFLMTGFMKLATPMADLATSLPWTTDFPEAMVRFIGIAEVLGGLGLLLPSILRIKPVLTPLAALGLATVMVLAMGLHLMRGESQMIVMNLILAAIAVFIAWGRFKKAPIASR